MINAQTVQNCGVQIADMNGIVHNVVAVVIRLTVLNSSLDAAASHPDSEAATVMVTTVFFAGQAALSVDGAAELTAPHNQCFIQHSAGFQVFDQCCRSLIHVGTLSANLSGQIAVLVPATVEQLNETNTTLGQSASQQTIGRVRTRLPGRRTVQFKDVTGFFGQVH